VLRKKTKDAPTESTFHLGLLLESEQTSGDETVFQRLYDDGLIRVARLEKLREKVRKERSKLGYSDKEEARRC